MQSCELFIVGAGTAGLSAARAAAEQGCRSIVVADWHGGPGGILRQCAHRGFGADHTGPEYIQQLLADYPQNVRFLWKTTVLSVDENRTAVFSSAEHGLQRIAFRQMVLAAGCREITAGSIGIGGTRPKGVFTAGQVQADMNLQGIMPEGPVVILGSGDLGLIMARQLAETGTEIAAIIEKKNSCGGLARNRRCVSEFQLRLICGATVAQLFGEKQLTGVSIRHADTGLEERIACKTLLIAAGLLPDQELIRNLGRPEWLHLCGNCSRIHSIVETVVQEGSQAGISACEKLRG